MARRELKTLTANEMVKLTRELCDLQVRWGSMDLRRVMDEEIPIPSKLFVLEVAEDRLLQDYLEAIALLELSGHSNEAVWRALVKIVEDVSERIFAEGLSKPADFPEENEYGPRSLTDSQRVILKAINRSRTALTAEQVYDSIRAMKIKLSLESVRSQLVEMNRYRVVDKTGHGYVIGKAAYSMPRVVEVLEEVRE